MRSGKIFRLIIIPFVFLFLFSFFIGCQSKYLDSKLAIDKRVDDLLSKMNLNEKIGQMTQIDKTYLQLDTDIANYYLGSIIYGGNSGPGNKTPKDWVYYNDKYQKAAQTTRLKIPLLIGVDLIHGAAQIKGGVIFPHNIGMGCIKNNELIQQAGHITAIEGKSCGINWTFSPCIAVAQDERWGRTYESFSENPDIVSLMGSSVIKGYQGDNLNSTDSILACTKHFLADGGTLNGIDQGDAQIDEATLRKIHLKPYVDAINANVGTIMASFSSWNGVKNHGNKYIITDILKNELKFKGFVVSDWSALKQLSKNPAEYIKMGINAGIDMVMVPDDYSLFTKTLTDLVENKSISIDKINDSVRRILRVKFEMGLFDNPITANNNFDNIGSKEHRDVARQCVNDSLVILKNTNNILPISKNIKRIHVAGKNADNLGYQCGGWTLSWQGLSGNITDGTTILKGIKESVDASTKITYSVNGLGAKGSDLCILVIGEKPYAENQGDSADLALQDEDIIAINNVKKSGVPVIVVLITGRPVIITDYMNNWNAVVAAWLPGTEGGGVADILFGKVKPTGKLSFSWPKNINQVPINYGDKNYDPLFPFGFGLEY